MIRTGTGRMVPASKPFGASRIVVKKFLVVLQYYNGDVEFAEELASLICDLERTRNHDADILLVRRHDAREMTATIKAKLESKFDRVLTHTCRRFAKGYPFACNEMWYDLIMMLAQTMPYQQDYYAFINLEPDAVPTRPGWISELINAWKAANSEGLSAIGYIHDNPVKHMNGLAVYAADLYNRVGSGTLAGGSPQVCYDIRHARSLLPLAKASPLIHFHYRHSTTTPAEVFQVRDGIEPAIFHGVKDRTAIMAVRDRHVSMKAPVKPAAPVAPAENTDFDPPPEAKTEVKRPNAYTYFHRTTGTSIENQAILDLWRKGWATRGWNPVILTFADAVKHPKYTDYELAVSKLPCATGDRKKWAHRLYRWLALDSVGGGLMVDYDVLPEDFTPDALNGSTRVFRSDPADLLFGMHLSKEGSEAWLKSIMTYDAQPDDVVGAKPHVTDDTVARRLHKPEAISPSMVHFSSFGVGRERKSVAMERFLSGK